MQSILSGSANATKPQDEHDLTKNSRKFACHFCSKDWFLHECRFLFFS